MAGLRKFVPLFDRVLVQRFVAETSSKGGIILPEKSVGKMVEATVVAVGPGGRNQSGETVPVGVCEGDKVLLPEYGGTKIEMNNQTEYILNDRFNKRTGRIIGVFKAATVERAGEEIKIIKKFSMPL